MTLIGNVKGKTCIIVDDMIDTAGTLCKAAETLKEMGATKVYAFASHGVFSGKAAENIKGSVLEKVVVSDSMGLEEKFVQGNGGKVVQVSIDLLLAEVIRRMENEESV